MMRTGYGDGGIGHFQAVFYDRQTQRWICYSTENNNKPISDSSGRVTDDFFETLKNANNKYEVGLYSVPSEDKAYFSLLNDYVTLSRTMTKDEMLELVKDRFDADPQDLGLEPDVLLDIAVTHAIMKNMSK